MIVDAILSVLTGGASGLLGTVVGKVASYFEHKQKMEEKRQDNAHELLLLDKQAAMRVTEMENEAAIAETQAWALSRTASYEQQSSGGPTYKWVVAVLKLVRPTLTVMLMVMTGSIFFTVVDLGIRSDVVNGILFLTTMSISWWFGDRAPSRSKDK